MTATAEVPKRTRRPWRGSEIAVLVQHFTHGGLDATLKSYPPGEHHRVRAKLVELGLVEKAPKPTLTDDSKRFVDKFIVAMKGELPHDPTQAVLVARYAIKELAALLPQRKKAEK